MIQIVIVDDNEDMRHIAEECVQKTVASAEREGVRTLTFGSAQEFLDWTSGERDDGPPNRADICILDIEMPGMSGMDLARQLREEQEDAQIIFLTSYEQFALESYELDAFQYILKSRMEERLPCALERLFERLDREYGNYRVVEHSARVVKLLYRDVLYVKKEGKYVVYVTKTGEIKERTALEKIRSELEDEGFVMIERGYMANIRHIARIQSADLFLDSGEKLYIGRRLVSDVKKAVSSYWKEHI